MNSVDVLFVISTIMVPLLLISLSYSSITEFYEYSVPFNKSVIIPNFQSNEQNDFKNVQNQTESTCYNTVHENLFCYTKPRIYDESQLDHLSSFIVGENGINGEIHFDRVGLEGGIFTIKNMSLTDELDTVLITFADKEYRIGNKDRIDYQIAEKFEFSTLVKKFDTFITHCGNNDSTAATLVQYLGVERINDVDYFLTWHTVITSDEGLPCNYPEIIQHSLDHEFGI